MLKKYFSYYFLILLAAAFISGCSASDPAERRGETSENKPAQETANPVQETPQPVTVKEPETKSEPAKVEPETQIKAEPLKNVLYTVQLGAFKEIANVEKFEKLIKAKFTLPIKTEPDSNSGTYKVTIGKFESKEEAYKVRDFCVQQGYKDAWVTEYK